jgi:cellobiose phosphorylase
MEVPHAEGSPGPYGYFDDAAREYVITDPRTPVKWVNYVGSLSFGGIVDHTGGALLCAGDPGLNRITKYIPQTPASDFKGSTLYLKVTRDGAARIITPFFTPGLEELDHYECHVGLSYQRIVSEVAGVRVEVTIFVPPGDPMEIRDITVTNVGEGSAEVEVVPVVEYSHFDAFKQLANADWVPQTMMSEALPLEEGRLALLQYAFMRKDGAVNFMSASAPVQSFESDRARFLGANEYGTWRAPLALLEPALSNYEARRGDNIGALRLRLGRLAPGASGRVAAFLGQAPRAEVPTLVGRYCDPAAIDAALAELADAWDGWLSVLECRTPDPAFDSMVNIHNARQCLVTLNWSRYLSLYQLGIGTRGIGFRDSSQDVMGALAADPAAAVALIRRLLSIQCADGSAMHQFYPATMHADHGDAAEEPEKGKLTYGDDHLWIVLAVAALVKETGDLSFLSEEISFYAEGVPPEQRESATVLAHLERALEYTRTHVGRHGLPLLGYADWNDTVNLPGDAESVFNACLYGTALLEMESLCRHLGRETQADRYRADHQVMAERVNDCAWDGQWYVRYFTEDGQPLGSRTNARGSLYTNGQSWPVLAGFAPPERAVAALDSVREQLNTRFGITLSGPGYDGYDAQVGGVTSYPPGAKENGGIFLHANPWVMIAETMLGRGDRAYEYYCQINPAQRNDDIDRFQVEPYCYPQNILGDEHPQFGLGRNSWLSGTASWTYQAATRFILGIRPDHAGLIVDPCIPPSWESFEVRRRFRGAEYLISVRNPHGVSRGVVRLTVDGHALEGSVVPLLGPGEHAIEVELGPQDVTGASVPTP